jgi:hypothetical protein
MRRQCGGRSVFESTAAVIADEGQGMIEKAVSTCVVSSRSRQEGVLVTCAERFWDPEVRDFSIWWVADWCRDEKKMSKPDTRILHF